MSRHGVEWYDRDAGGVVRYGSRQPSGARPVDLVEAAIEAQRAAGGRRRSCVLAIDHTLCEHRLIAMPPVPHKELPRIFERKAKQLVRHEGERILYTALPMGETEAEGGTEKLRNWLLVAFEADYLREVRLRLRAHGFKIKRVVSRSLAALCRAQAEIASSDDPFISVSVDHGVATVSLAHGEELVYRDRIEGDILTDASLPTSVVQLVRSCAAYWRKHSRGQTVEDVVLIGMPTEQGRLLSHAIAGAVGGGNVHVLPSEGADPMLGRFAFLESSIGTGRLCPDLSSPLPAHTPLAAVLIAIFLFLTGTLAWIVHDDSSADLRDVQLDTAALNTRISELSRFGEENDRIDREVQLLRDHLGRSIEVGTYGVRMEELLVSALTAFDGRASLSDITVTPGKNGGKALVLRGIIDPDPTRLLRDLHGLTRDLEADPALADVTLTLQDTLPDDRLDHREPFYFSIAASLEESR